MIQHQNISADSVQRMEHENPDHAQFALILWSITNRCNYRCPYCNSATNGGHFPGLNLDVCRRFVDRTLEHYAGKLGKKVYFEFTGGEATLFPGLQELLQYIKAQNGYCGLLSNGSPPISSWDALSPLLDHLCLSFHPRQARYESFREVARKVHQETSTHFNIMMYPPLFDRSLEIATDLRSTLTNSSIALQPLLESLRPGEQLMHYTEAQKKAISEFDCSIPSNRKIFSMRGGMKLIDSNGDQVVVLPPEILLGQINRWKGWTCWAGLECLVISGNGEVYRSWCLQDRLGNIQSNDYSLPVSPTICKREECHANCDMMLSRIRQPN